MSRDDHGAVCIILAMEDQELKTAVGVYQADLSSWTRLKLYTLPLLVALAMRLPLHPSDMRMSNPHVNEAHCNYKHSLTKPNWGLVRARFRGSLRWAYTAKNEVIGAELDLCSLPLT